VYIAINELISILTLSTLNRGIANMELYSSQGGAVQKLTVFEVALLSNLIPQVHRKVPL
jgi:hypothetical protein